MNNLHADTDVLYGWMDRCTVLDSEVRSVTRVEKLSVVAFQIITRNGGAVPRDYLNRRDGGLIVDRGQA